MQENQRNRCQKINPVISYRNNVFQLPPLNKIFGYTSQIKYYVGKHQKQSCVAIRRQMTALGKSHPLARDSDDEGNSKEGSVQRECEIESLIQSKIER